MQESINIHREPIDRCTLFSGEVESSGSSAVGNQPSAASAATVRQANQRFYLAGTDPHAKVQGRNTPDALTPDPNYSSSKNA